MSGADRIEPEAQAPPKNAPRRGSSLRGGLVGSLVFAAVLVVAAVIFFRPLKAWFTGQSLGGGGSTVTARAGDFVVRASLDPDLPALKGNAMLIEVRDGADKSIDDATIELGYDMPAMGNMAEMKGTATVKHDKNGRYRAEFDLPMDGTWTLPMTLRTPNGTGSLAFTMTVGRLGLTATGGDGGASEIDHYTCSMHPSVREASPGKCPICGMDLIPVTKEQQKEGVVLIDRGRRQLIGVRTAPVIEGPMTDTFVAAGRVAYDEAGLEDVNLKVRGWITKLLVNKTGERVTAGQTLFTVYSPELYAAEQDFILATKGATTSDSGAVRADPVSRGARQRLRLLGMYEWQIDAVAKNGAPLENLSVVSPANGYVIEKNVVEGDSVDAGMRLYRIAALDRVWVEADVYEADLPRAKVGQTARVTLDYLPGHSYDAKVSYVSPYLDPKSRTGRVRIELANKELELRPGMYVSVELGTDLGKRIQVPASAVIYTGPRRLVFVDLGDGRFRPQEVHVGVEAGGVDEVLDGLKPGDIVATSGVFLIAAEARISTAAKYWDSDAEDGAVAAAASSASASMPPMPGMSAAPSLRGPSTSSSARPTDSPRSAATSGGTATGQPNVAPGASKETVYTCPMHPEVRSAAPGQCPKCGMDLVPTRDQQ